MVAALPEVNAMMPAVPELVAPVVNCKCPLTPATPALAVVIITWPLLFDVPAPVDMLMDPPVKSFVVPDTNDTSPPLFSLLLPTDISI